MMRAGLVYEDFGMDTEQDWRPTTASREALEDEKLQAFENGYQAGWDDSTKAQTDLNNTISSALAANLQDASFQYHEMRTQMTRSLHDIMRGIVDTILPDIARRSLGATVVQLVERHARNALDRRIQICIPETARDLVDRLLPDTPIEYDLVADPALPPDQASIRVGDIEHAVDLGQVVKDVGAAVEAYFETQLSEAQDDRPS